MYPKFPMRDTWRRSWTLSIRTLQELRGGEPKILPKLTMSLLNDNGSEATNTIGGPGISTGDLQVFLGNFLSMNIPGFEEVTLRVGDNLWNNQGSSPVNTGSSRDSYSKITDNTDGK